MGQEQSVAAAERSARRLVAVNLAYSVGLRRIADIDFTEFRQFSILGFLFPGADTDGNLVPERNHDLSLVV